VVDKIEQKFCMTKDIKLIKGCKKGKERGYLDCQKKEWGRISCSYHIILIFIVYG